MLVHRHFHILGAGGGQKDVSPLPNRGGGSPPCPPPGLTPQSVLLL